jgi:hypothetical protein
MAVQAVQAVVAQKVPHLPLVATLLIEKDQENAE